jgi:hypothetical protein
MVAKQGKRAKDVVFERRVARVLREFRGRDLDSTQVVGFMVLRELRKLYHAAVVDASQPAGLSSLIDKRIGVADGIVLCAVTLDIEEGAPWKRERKEAKDEARE